MNLPCKCVSLEVCRHAQIKHLATTDERYAKRWGVPWVGASGAARARTPAKPRVRPAARPQRQPSGVPVSTTKRVEANCIHLGQVVSKTDEAGLSCDCASKWLRQCGVHGLCSIGAKRHDAACCSGCPDRVSRSAKVGIALGCYNLPKLAELQVVAVEKTNGSIPILLCDDHSPRVGDYAAIAAKYAHVTCWHNEARLGHYAGDLSVFRKAIQWGHANGLDYVIKLSQRFIWLKPNWATSAAKRAADEGAAIVMQSCVDNHTDLKIRSECVLLDVKKWLPIVPEMSSDRLGAPTELAVWHFVHRHFGGKFTEWPGMPVDRYKAMAGTVWHCSHSKSQFEKLAAYFKLPLDDDFDCMGWNSKPDWKVG